MADVQGLCFEPDFRLLICKIHGTGVHPTKEAIQRHLRRDRHHCKGKLLKEAVDALTQLPLRSLQELRESHPLPAAQPIPAIPYLTVVPGWSCRACEGKELTASAEVRNRHVSKVHHKRASSHSKERPLWDDCELQTLFSMTGDVRYFRVVSTSAVCSDEQTRPDPVDPEDHNN